MKKNILLFLSLIGLIGLQWAMDNDDNRIVKPTAQEGINIGQLERLAEQNIQNYKHRNRVRNPVQYKLLLDRKQKITQEKQKLKEQAEKEQILKQWEVWIENKDSQCVERLKQLPLTNDMYFSVYYWALQHGNIEVIKFFIEKDKKYINSINPKRKGKCTCPLIIAHRHNQQEVKDLLLKDYNADYEPFVNFVCKRKEKPIKN